MKKLALLLACSIMLLTACGSGSPTTEASASGGPTAVAAVPADPPGTILRSDHRIGGVLLEVYAPTATPSPTFPAGTMAYAKYYPEQGYWKCAILGVPVDLNNRSVVDLPGMTAIKIIDLAQSYPVALQLDVSLATLTR